MFKSLKNILKPACFFVFISFLAIGVWLGPDLLKGYAAYTVSMNTLLAKNHYLTGLYSAESNLNVFLAPSLIAEQGQISAYGNKFSTLFYSWLFRLIGLPSANNLVLISILIHLSALLVFILLIWRLFDFKTSFVFSLIYIFIPFNWYTTYRLAFYEFALFFFSLFFLFFLEGLERNRQPQKSAKTAWFKGLCFVLAGLFLALTCLAKEAFLLIVPFLIVYLWLKKLKKPLVYVFSVFLILFIPLWLLSFSNNIYYQGFFTSSEQETLGGFAFYCHVYPDPYTYHFEKDEYLAETKAAIENNRLVLLKEIDRTRELKNLGIEEISLTDRIKAGLMLGSRHIFRFVSLEHIGGPFVFLLLLFGFYRLWYKKKDLAQFLAGWILSSIFLMGFVVLAGRDHLVDFNWGLVLLISLGLISLSEVLTEFFHLGKNKKFILELCLLLLLLYHLVLAAHVAWGRLYEQNKSLLVTAYSQKINKMDIDDQEVIAVNLSAANTFNLNYQTGKSVVVFTPETIAKLLEENKLADAFEKFNVKYILGYSSQQTKQIIEQTKVVNIASQNVKVIMPEISRNRGWLMNLVK